MWPGTRSDHPCGVIGTYSGGDHSAQGPTTDSLTAACALLTLTDSHCRTGTRQLEHVLSIATTAIRAKQWMLMAPSVEFCLATLAYCCQMHIAGFGGLRAQQGRQQQQTPALMTSSGTLVSVSCLVANAP
eukprot:GHRR01035032.1.p1 GENE.GHRR01035032.1~~GHRR01035032.1.p1  ORF type:complete len:130 (-),score=16.19 GHRR01035032.1:211-600(-)